VATSDVVTAPKTPKIFPGVYGKVAHALFNASRAANTLEATRDSFIKFHTEWTVQKMRPYLSNPLIPTATKVANLRERIMALGGTPQLADSLLSMYKGKNLHKHAEVRRMFTALMVEHRRDRSGAIVSAEPLTDQQYAAITAKMQKMVEPGDNLVIQRVIEPDVVGGFLLRIDGKAQDLSVATQIARMEQHLQTFFKNNAEAAAKVLAM